MGVTITAFEIAAFLGSHDGGLSFALLQVDPSLFPRGYEQYVLGGALIGIGVSIIYGLTAIIPGSSTWLESTLSYVSADSRFDQYVPSRSWRNVFTLGMVSGGVLYVVLVTGDTYQTGVQWYRLLVGGFFVGVGTRLGKGCTTGHGICGIASRSPTSIANVLTFLAVGIATASIVHSLGVRP
ncbi:MAG: YeeE/YedE family protein [Halanaeroarchaeum sp.]